MDDLSVNLNKLQMGCLYAGTLINHLIYADDFYMFSPSVAGLRKRTDCCAKYGVLYKKNVHCIHLNNHPLPYTTKCKYIGHIINKNLTDDDDTARQKDAFMHKLMY